MLPNISDISLACNSVSGTVTAKPVLSVTEATGLVKNASSDGCLIFFIIISFSVKSP